MIMSEFSLSYYEVAEDTMMFAPAECVDISTVETRRREACYAHASQQPALAAARVDFPRRKASSATPKAGA